MADKDSSDKARQLARTIETYFDLDCGGYTFEIDGDTDFPKGLASGEYFVTHSPDPDYIPHGSNAAEDASSAVALFAVQLNDGHYPITEWAAEVPAGDDGDKYVLIASGYDAPWDHECYCGGEFHCDHADQRDDIDVSTHHLISMIEAAHAECPAQLRKLVGALAQWRDANPPGAKLTWRYIHGTSKNSIPYPLCPRCSGYGYIDVEGMCWAAYVLERLTEDTPGE